MKLISIIVPVFNVEASLKKCLDSILNQTYRDLDIILIDDGSTDQCGMICEEYAEADSRVRVFHTENRGLSIARNLGIQEAKGEYIGFVDSDDWIEVDMYKTLHDTIKRNKADICECGLWQDGMLSSKSVCPETAIYKGVASFEALICGKIQNYVWNKLYIKSIFKTLFFL